MPSISKDGTFYKIRWDWDDWSKGLAPDWGSVGQAQRLTRGFGTATAIDPNRRPGYLLPGFDPAASTNASTAFDGVAKNGVVHNDKAYIVAGGEVHELTLSTNTITNAGAFPHTIDHGHTSETVEDCVMYYVSGTKYLFYSFNDATDGDVGRYDLSSTFDDNYMSTVPTSGAVLDKDYPHPMIVGDDDILYIGDGPNLASYNATTGVFNSSALDLPAGYVITTYSKTQNFLVVYAYRETDGASLFKTDCSAFFWDYLSDSFTYAYPLAGNFVSGGFTLNGTPGCFVQGQSFLSAKDNKLLLFDGASFSKKVSFENDIPVHGGVEAFDDVVIWNGGGEIYQWGSQHEGFDRVLNKPMTTGGSTSGMFRSFRNAFFHASSENDLVQLGTGFSTGNVTIPIVSPQFPHGQYGRLEKLRVYWYSQNQSAGGSNFDLSLNVDKDQTTYRPIKDINSTSSLVTEYRELVAGEAGGVIKLQDLKFESVGLTMDWGNNEDTEPIGVQAVELFYSYTNI